MLDQPGLLQNDLGGLEKLDFATRIHGVLESYFFDRFIMQNRSTAA